MNAFHKKPFLVKERAFCLLLILIVSAVSLSAQTDTVIIARYPVALPYVEVTATVTDWDTVGDTLGIHNYNPTGSKAENDALKDAYLNAYTNMLIAPFKELRNENPLLSGEPVVYLRTTLVPADIDSMRLVFTYDKFPNTVSSFDIVSLLSLYRLDLSYDPARWHVVPSAIDTVLHTISALVEDPGYYAVFAGAEKPDASLYNVTSYPNPFGYGERSECTISYGLGSNSDVTIRIFAPGGGEVYHETFSAGQPGGIGSADGLYLNQVVWDGRNKDGRRVDSGGYLCKIMVKNGSTGTWKIGVVR